MDELDRISAEYSETLATGTPPGKPKTPQPLRVCEGIIRGLASTSVTVEFPSDPAGTDLIISGIHVIKGGRAYALGDVVLVLQVGTKRIVLGAIS